MTPTPVQPAQIDFTDPAAPRSRDHNDVYASRSGALAQARAVFLAGCGLPERWRGRADFTLLETGFGLGLNFLATQAAWLQDAAAPTRLHYVAVDNRPPSRDDLARAHAACLAGLGAAEAAALQPLCDALQADWPPAVAGMHLRDLQGGQLRLMLIWADVDEALRALVARVDAIFLDGFAPARNPEMWSDRLWPALARLAAPGATAATWSAARPVRDGLARAGFEVQRVPGFGAKRHATQARFQPRVAPQAPPGRRASAVAGEARHALVVGAGLAGALSAQALASEGWRVTVLEATDAPARGASGNVAGLFHGTVHVADGPHALLLQACARHAAAVYARCIADHGVPGAVDGVFRLHAGGPAAAAPHESVAKAWSREMASQYLGVPVSERGWWFPQGGWLDPRALVQHLLRTPGVSLLSGRRVQALRHAPQGWQALGEDSEPLASAPVLVLCNAQDAARLLPALQPALHAVRGQVTQLAASADLPRPEAPLAGDGYWIALPDGSALIGATAQPDDLDPALRAADEAHNRARAARLVGRPLDAFSSLGGRVGWRCTAPDRLPLMGPLPAAWAPHAPADSATAGAPTQARHVPRCEGLYLFTALGSRGLTFGPLLARSLAAWIAGTPSPLPSRALDAVDPARLITRGVRREASAQARSTPEPQSAGG